MPFDELSAFLISMFQISACFKFKMMFSKNIFGLLKVNVGRTNRSSINVSNKSSSSFNKFQLQTNQNLNHLRLFSNTTATTTNQSPQSQPQQRTMTQTELENRRFFYTHNIERVVSENKRSGNNEQQQEEEQNEIMQWLDASKEEKIELPRKTLNLVLGFLAKQPFDENNNSTETAFQIFNDIKEPNEGSYVLLLTHFFRDSTISTRKLLERMESLIEDAQKQRNINLWTNENAQRLMLLAAKFDVLKAKEIFDKIIQFTPTNNKTATNNNSNLKNSTQPTQTSSSQQQQSLSSTPSSKVIQTFLEICVTNGRIDFIQAVDKLFIKFEAGVQRVDEGDDDSLEDLMAEMSRLEKQHEEQKSGMKKQQSEEVLKKESQPNEQSSLISENNVETNETKTMKIESNQSSNSSSVPVKTSAPSATFEADESLVGKFIEVYCELNRLGFAFKWIDHARVSGYKLTPQTWINFVDKLIETENQPSSNGKWRDTWLRKYQQRQHLSTHSWVEWTKFLDGAYRQYVATEKAIDAVLISNSDLDLPPAERKKLEMKRKAAKRPNSVISPLSVPQPGKIELDI